MEGGLPSELPGTAPLECGEFQRPESLCADRNELGSQSPEFPWQDEDDEDDDEDEDDNEECESPPQDCDLQDVCDKEIWRTGEKEARNEPANIRADPLLPKLTQERRLL